MKTALKRILLLVLTVISTADLAGFAADYDDGSTVGPSKGWLIINGGHGIVPELVDRFVKLAGGVDAQYVLIPTAQPDSLTVDADEMAANFRRQFGVRNVTVLHTRDSAEADSPEFVAPLKKASAVWIAGGRQWRLADAYLDTLTEHEIKALLARGGVVGGGSAGATIQGSFLVRGSPAGNKIMISPSRERGFGLLPDSAIDQHIDARGRIEDLNVVLKRHPTLLGIGLDERTAIVVHGDQFEVIGNGRVVIHDGKKHNGHLYYFLLPGQIFNLRTRSVE